MPWTDTSLIKHHPASQPARRRQKSGGVMDCKRSQDRPCCRSSLRFSWTTRSSRSLLPSLWAWEVWKDGSRCETSHSWAEWAFVSWLITADSCTHPPPLHIPSAVSFSPSISSLPAPSCCSPVEKKDITNDKRRLPNLSSGKTFSVLSPCVPAECRLPKERKEEKWLWTPTDATGDSITMCPVLFIYSIIFNLLFLFLWTAAFFLRSFRAMRMLFLFSKDVIVCSSHIKRTDYSCEHRVNVVATLVSLQQASVMQPSRFLFNLLYLSLVF